jgi:hypothetical protein
LRLQLSTFSNGDNDVSWGDCGEKKSTAVAATTLALSTFVASSAKPLLSSIPSTCITPSYLYNKPNYSQISSIPRGGANNSNDDKIVDDIIQQKNPYSILGVSRNASSLDIQRAYRRRAVITHPDKRNGDRRAFDKLSEAYNGLNDDNSRRLYDKTGTMDPHKQQEQSHLNEQDVLRQFFFGEDIKINDPFGNPFGNSFSKFKYLKLGLYKGPKSAMTSSKQVSLLTNSIFADKFPNFGVILSKLEYLKLNLFKIPW